MFGTKRNKEQQERIEYLEQKLAEQEAFIRQLAGAKQGAEEHFATIRKQDERIRQQLSDITEVIRIKKDTAEHLCHETEQTGDQLKELAEQTTERIRREKIVDEFLQKAADIPQKIELIKKQQQGAWSIQQESNEACNQSIEKLSEQLFSLQEKSKNMSVLALNAAIEAGRMGEGGMKFLHASEEIRQMAEEYAQGLQEMTDGLQKIQTVWEDGSLSDSIGTIGTQLESFLEETGEIPPVLDADDVQRGRGQGMLEDACRQAENLSWELRKQIEADEDCRQRTEEISDACQTNRQAADALENLLTYLTPQQAEGR